MDTTDAMDAMGFKLIGEMTKEELVAEVVEEWRRDVNSKEITELKELVVRIRMAHIQQRMLKEAGLSIRTGILGIPHVTEENEEDNG